MVSGLRYHNVSSVCAGNELSVAINAAGDLFVRGAVRVSPSHPSSPYHERTGERFPSYRTAKGRSPCQLASTASKLPPDSSVPSLTRRSRLSPAGRAASLLSLQPEHYAYGVKQGYRPGTTSHGANVVRYSVRISLPRVVHVAAGSMHSFAIDSIGDIWGWGLNLRGQVGIEIREGGYEGIIQTPR